MILLARYRRWPTGWERPQADRALVGHVQLRADVLTGTTTHRQPEQVVQNGIINSYFARDWGCGILCAATTKRKRNHPGPRAEKKKPPKRRGSFSLHFGPALHDECGPLPDILPLAQAVSYFTGSSTDGIRRAFRQYYREVSYQGWPRRNCFFPTIVSRLSGPWSDDFSTDLPGALANPRGVRQTRASRRR